jgi:nicotinate-nucleotide adenylyltransferase
VIERGKFWTICDIQRSAEIGLTRKIGLYGGTFDPPHLGHLISAQTVAEAIGLDRVIFLPVGQPPHKRNHPISPADRRVEMVSLAIAENPIFELSDWEIRQDGPGYTIHTIRHFQQEMAEDELYWIIGADSLADLPTWFEFESLIESTNIVTAWRGGIDLEQVLATLKGQLKPAHFEKLRKNIVRTPMIEIAARDLRTRVRQGQSLRYFVPAAVEAYIDKEGLYR